MRLSAPVALLLALLALAAPVVADADASEGGNETLTTAASPAAPPEDEGGAGVLPLVLGAIGASALVVVARWGRD